MSDKLPPSIFPARFQILSGSMLKLLACIAMLIDHTGAIILSHYPHDRRKYGRNLLLFALISEIPWNFMFANTWHYADKQNVFFTLFLGYLAFCALEYFWETPWMQLFSLLALLGISILLHADYGWRGFIFLVLMYLLRNEKVSQAIVGSCWLSYEWKACFAFISINMYNGKRGFIRGKAAKYFFYLFYPVHITILVIIRNLFFL